MSPVAEAIVTGPTDLDVKVHKEPKLARIDVGLFGLYVWGQRSNSLMRWNLSI
jgi:hypothetical protein